MTTSQQDQAFLAYVMPADLLETAIAFVADNFSPEDVFDGNRLAGWAEENGYAREAV